MYCLTFFYFFIIIFTDVFIYCDLEKGQFIQGLVAHYNDKKRIYVVTVEPEPLTREIHDRWPRVVGNQKPNQAL